jgi:hypothetical protein
MAWSWRARIVRATGYRSLTWVSTKSPSSALLPSLRARMPGGESHRGSVPAGPAGSRRRTTAGSWTDSGPRDRH